MSSLYLSWNRLPHLRPAEIHSLDMPVLPKRISTPVFTVQGNARSYGDVCLTEKGVLLKTLGLNKLIVKMAYYNVMLERNCQIF